jgi:hypothetical protein
MDSRTDGRHPFKDLVAWTLVFTRSLSGSLQSMTTPCAHILSEVVDTVIFHTSISKLSSTEGKFLLAGPPSVGELHQEVGRVRYMFALRRSLSFLPPVKLYALQLN